MPEAPCHDACLRTEVIIVPVYGLDTGQQEAVLDIDDVKIAGRFPGRSHPCAGGKAVESIKVCQIAVDIKIIKAAVDLHDSHRLYLLAVHVVGGFSVLISPAVLYRHEASICILCGFFFQGFHFLPAFVLLDIFLDGGLFLVLGHVDGGFLCGRCFLRHQGRSRCYGHDNGHHDKQSLFHFFLLSQNGHFAAYNKYVIFGRGKMTCQ